jgi:hypothetical protein
MRAVATVKAEEPPSDDCDSVVYDLEALAVGVKVLNVAP